MSEAGEVKSGLTYRAWLALFTAEAFFIPVNIYTTLTLGVLEGSIAVFFITLIFSEVTRLTGLQMTRQEIFMIYSAAQWGGMGLPVFFQLVYRSYFVNSPFAWSYRVGGIPLALLVPEWLVPPPGSPAYNNRTLFQPAFFVPIMITSIWMILGLLGNVFLGIIVAKIYVERLKFPFPLAGIESSLVIFLSERPREYAKYFLGALALGIILGSMFYLPVSLGVPLIPIPFWDLTWILQEILPGSLFALVTTPSTYVTGLLIPFNAATYMLIISVIMWIFLNSFFITMWPNAFPRWTEEYSKGMGLIAIQNRASLRVWFPCQIGFALAASLFVIYKARKTLYKVVAEVARKKEEYSELPLISKAIAGWLLVSGLSISIYYFLLPEVPIWIPILYTLVFSFLVSTLLAASVGEVGFLPAAVYNMLGQIWYPMVYSTPYQGYAAFAFTPPLSGVRSGSFSQSVKAAYIVRAKPIDLVKIWIVGGIFAQLIGTVMIDFLWRIAPIPSSAYPYSIFSALQQTYNDAIIATRQLDFSAQTIFIPMVILLMVIFAGDFLVEKKKIFFSSLGILMGAFTGPHGALAIFIGSLLSRFLMSRFFGGGENWLRIRNYVVSGYLAGEGLILMLGVTLIMVHGASWLWPW